MKLIDRVVFVLILLVPTGALALKKWSNSLFILAVSASIISILFSRKLGSDKFSSWLWLLSISFGAPFFVDLLMQILRQNIIWSQLDAPSRLLLGIPILLFCAYRGEVKYQPFILILSLCIFLTLTSILTNPTGLEFWGRWATSFADPNSLGSVSAIAVAGLLFLCLVHYTDRDWLRLVIGLTALALGLLILLKSQSRGGWLVFLVLTPLVIYLAMRIKLRGIPYLGIATATVILSLIVIDKSLYSRAVSIYLESIEWLNNQHESMTSIGIRLNMLDASWALIKHSPLVGYGDHGYKQILESGIVGQFSAETLEGMSVTPHNEIVGKTLRSGILGGLASFFVFAVPVIFFGVMSHKGSQQQTKIAACLGLITVIGFFIAGLSAGILGLAYISSLYAVSVMSLAGISLAHFYSNR